MHRYGGFFVKVFKHKVIITAAP